MQAKAIKGYLDNGLFTPYETITLPKRAEVVLVLYEDEDMQQRIAWLNRMEKAISESADEYFPEIVRPKMKPPLFKISDINSLLSGSITESLIGAIPQSNKTLDDYRLERLSKYEIVN